MHKTFYASGFLYHAPSQQILLQQINSADNNSSWSLVGKKEITNKTGEEVFMDIFSEELNIKLKLKSVNLVYTYSSDEKGLNFNIYYAEVKKLHKSPNDSGNVFAWFNFKQIQKLNLSEQAKQDIIIGQRVINSSIRKSLGQQTIG